MSTPGEPIYKGTKGPLVQSRDRTWQRGRGWQSTINYKGDTNAVMGQLPGLIAFCSEVNVRDGGGPYSEITGKWSGFNEGQHDENVELAITWELHQQMVELDILEHANANLVESYLTGSKQAIRLAVQEFKKKSATDTVTLPYRSTKISNFISDPTVQAVAFDLFDLIIEGQDKFRAYQPIVARTLIVSEVYSTYGATPVSPIIYETFAAFNRVIGPPAILQAALPTSGSWFETPPQVQQTAQSKFSISQTWEWALFIDPFVYDNRVT